MQYELKPNGWVVNDSGQVGMVHHDSNPSTIQIEADGVSYSFSPHDGVSFCWVDPKYVDTLLAIRAQVCCGRIANKFFLSNMAQACLWQDRKRC